MDYFSFPVRRLPSGEKIVTVDPWYRDLPSSVRGDHLALLIHCANSENSGRIRGAQGWSERQWDRHVGVTLRALRAVVSSGLAAWDDDDLVVSMYDPAQEGRARSRSDKAKHAAEAKARQEREEKERQALLPASPSTAPGTAPSTAPGNAKERRGEERIKEPRDLLGPVAPGKEPSEHRRFVLEFTRLWRSAARTEDGPTWDGATGKIVHELLKRSGGTAAEALRRASLMFSTYRGAGVPTIKLLVGQWDAFAAEKSSSPANGEPPRRPPTIAELRAEMKRTGGSTV